jgi:hypothetical protein
MLPAVGHGWAKPTAQIYSRKPVTDSNYWQRPEWRLGCGRVCFYFFFNALEAVATMTWIRTIPFSEADDELRQAMEGQKSLYPREYATPVHPVEGGGSSIVASHSLIPQALHHAFSTFGALMSPDLPLQRRQHEMIATMVSVTNRCVY